MEISFVRALDERWVGEGGRVGRCKRDASFARRACPS